MQDPQDVLERYIVLMLRPIVAICATSPCVLCMMAEAVLVAPDPERLPDVPQTDVASAEACEASASKRVLTMTGVLAVWKLRMGLVLFLLDRFGVISCSNWCLG